MPQLRILLFKNVIFCRPLDKDRFMSPDIEAVKKLLQENKIWSAVQHHIAYYHAPQVCHHKSVWKQLH